MSRLIWMGVGAAGGIYVYRHGQKAWERTKERGVAGNTAVITRTVADIYRGIRDAEREELVDLTQQSTTIRITGNQSPPEIVDPLATDQSPAPESARPGAASPVRFLPGYRRRAS